MGKVEPVSKLQLLILEDFKNIPFLLSSFYFTGGTALSLFYLQHRESVDLDFFSESKIDVKSLTNAVGELKEKHNFSINYTPFENIHIFNLTFPNRQLLKIDFVYHPYKRIERGIFQDRIEVDSLIDIAINKLLASQQRNEVKDYVDLYFLLERFTVWDLITGVRAKYKISMEPYIIASEFFKVEHFTFLPKMIKPLKLEALQSFFRGKAKELGMQAVE